MTAEILLVDDNAIQAATRRSILSRAGRSVALAESASQALVMLQDEPLRKSIGLVITDHLMPGMNGPEFVVALRKVLPSIPVVVLSGYPDAEPEYEGLKVFFLLKPVAPEQLIRMVAELLDPPLTKSA